MYLLVCLQLLLVLQGHGLIDDVAGKQNTSFVILSTFLHLNEPEKRKEGGGGRGREEKRQSEKVKLKPECSRFASRPLIRNLSP